MGGLSGVMDKDDLGNSDKMYDNSLKNTITMDEFIDNDQ